MARKTKDFDHYLILALGTVIILSTFLFVFSRQTGPSPRIPVSAATLRTK